MRCHKTTHDQLSLGKSVKQEPRMHRTGWVWEEVACWQDWGQLGGGPGRGGMVHTKAQSPQRPPRSQQESRGRLRPKFGAPQTLTGLTLWPFSNHSSSHSLSLLCFPSSHRTLGNLCDNYAGRLPSTSPAPGAFNSMPPGLCTSLPGQASAGFYTACSLYFAYDRKRDRLVSLH